jgi:iron complex outermembrane receptor protein
MPDRELPSHSIRQGSFVGFVGLLLASAAPQGHAASDAPDAVVEEVVVTGTRVARSGYDSPTPVTVVDSETINAVAPTNLADFINELPAVVGSSTPNTTNRSQSSGAAGINSVNLRALGSTRTLVLLDGRRSVGSRSNGVVDVNTFPQSLVERVEIVTGGASAAYGSDAVSGVVNFILDQDFEGLKTEITAGQTTYGDDENWNLSVGYGLPFAEGRGHILLNGEWNRRDGIQGVPRDWNDDGWYLVNNPAYEPGNGLPERLVTPNAGQSVMTEGGIIVNTELRGTYFGVGGTVNQFAYGETRDPWTIGGDWRLGQSNDTVSLVPRDERDGYFGRVSYEFLPNLSGFVEASYNDHLNVGEGGSFWHKGNVRILADNAFIPESVQERIAELGITEFRLGTSNGDMPYRVVDNERQVERYVAGLNGDFTTLGRNWSWNAYYQLGITNTLERVLSNDLSNLGDATDAVRDPMTGEIVCRSTLTDPGNGCIPFNRMGIGVNSQEAIDYVIGFPQREQRFEQNVAAFNVNTDLPGLGDLPIGLAFGGEWRQEEVSGFVEERYQSGWRVGNYLPTFGEYDVLDVYVEALVPITRNLEFSGAVRRSDYSTSGVVNTWKAGLNWAVTDGLTLRGTRSRDIRGPGLSELFEAGRRRTNSLLLPNPDDPANPTTIQFTEDVTGNPDLEPEEADSLGIGLVWRPTFAPGLGMSVDYYQIEIDGAIGQLSAQQIVDRCFDGNEDNCRAIDFGEGDTGQTVITELRNQPFNFVTETAEGVDVEVSYQVPFEFIPGSLTFRGIGTYYIKYETDNGILPPEDNAGENAGSGPPDFLYRLSGTYTVDQLTFSVIGRGISSGVYDNDNIECTSGCPESNFINRTVNNNQIDGAFYVDAYAAYQLNFADAESEIFLRITNLFDKDPPIVARGPSDSSQVEPYTNQGLYDVIGRSFRLGVRLRL